MSARVGVLLVNLGSPEAPTSAAVGRYLRDFLMDPYVLTLPWPLRWLLVNAGIVPFRKSRSAEAYAKIWTTTGSPLLENSRELASALAASLPRNFSVELGMRYGNPSIMDALTRLKYAAVERILALPLYPQSAASSTETAAVAIARAARALEISERLTIAAPFYDDPGFIQALAAKIARAQAEFAGEHLLFSYHGLPVPAVAKSCGGASGCAAATEPCPRIDWTNQSCYRAQCYATTAAVARKLGLKKESYSVGFQSRLTERWIRPFSDELLVALAKKGVQRLLVTCPSFVADCLETLEEIELRARDDFRRAGGSELRLVRALNADPAWTEAVAALVQRAASDPEKRVFT